MPAIQHGEIAAISIYLETRNVPLIVYSMPLSGIRSGGNGWLFPNRSEENS